MKEKQTPKKKFNHKELKKSRIKKKMIKASWICAGILLGAIALTVLLINILPACRIYSDENTISVEGKVVEVSYEKIDMRNFGRGSRGHIIVNVYLMLDSGEEYEITDYEYRKYTKYSTDEFKNLVLNQEVEVRADKYLGSKLVTLNVDKDEVISYDITNEFSLNYREGVNIVALFAYLLILFRYVIEMIVLGGEYWLCSL